MNASIEILNPIDVLGERIAEAEALFDSAQYSQLVDIQRFDELGGWNRQGAKSCAHWLGWRCGLALDTAREKVRVANALVKLPAVGEALRLAEVGYSKVRAITRVANAEN